MKSKLVRTFFPLLLLAPLASVASLSTTVLLAGCGSDSAATVDAGKPDAAIALADAAPPDAVPPIDATPPPDAHPADLSCVGMVPPTSVVPDPLIIAGITRSIGTGGASPVGSVAVEARKADDSVVASATS